MNITKPSGGDDIEYELMFNEDTGLYNYTFIDSDWEIGTYNFTIIVEDEYSNAIVQDSNFTLVNEVPIINSISPNNEEFNINDISNISIEANVSDDGSPIVFVNITKPSGGDDIEDELMLMKKRNYITILLLILVGKLGHIILQ